MAEVFSCGQNIEPNQSYNDPEVMIAPSLQRDSRLYEDSCSERPHRIRRSAYRHS
jgi:hypothetical protein